MFVHPVMFFYERKIRTSVEKQKEKSKLKTKFMIERRGMYITYIIFTLWNADNQWGSQLLI